jgi:hypothetical protein
MIQNAKFLFSIIYFDKEFFYYFDTFVYFYLTKCNEFQSCLILIICCKFLIQ